MNDKEFLDKSIRRIKDFPKKGILFYDITSLLVNIEAFKLSIKKMCELYATSKVDGVAGIESRGFIFAAPLAQVLGVPLILIRKKGKLPGEVYSQEYALEYGTATIEVHKADIQKGQKILVIDDLIATGGTLKAAQKLLEAGGASVAGFFGIIGLVNLNYKEVLKGTRVDTLLEYNE